MCDPVTATIGGAALLGAGTAVYSAEKQRKAQKRAQEQAERDAQRTAKQAELETNRANSRTADSSAIQGRNAAGNAQGVGSTMLTGPMGVDPSALLLGQNTLLGG